MKFQWGETKAEINWRKHKIRFQTAVRVFLDPFAMTEQDRIEDGEYRFQTLELIDSTTILLVAHVDWEEDGAEVVRVISAREATPSEKNAIGKIVTYYLDLENPSPLSEEQRAKLEALKAVPDSEIDFSDIPPLTEKFWRNAKRNRYFRPIKQQLTLRLDSDLVAWLKHHAEGKRGYQSHINRALREYVSEQTKKAG